MKYNFIKIVFLLLIILFSQFLSAIELKTDDSAFFQDIYEFKDKVESRVITLTNEDLKIIDKYSKYIYEIKIYERLKQEQLRALFKSLELALELNLVNKTKLNKIRRMSVLATGFRFTSRFSSSINNIIWWVEARNFDNHQALFNFLQLHKSERGNIVKILTDLGQLENINILFKKNKLKMLAEKIEISNRQKLIIKALDKKSKKIVEHFRISYQTSITNIFQDFQKYSELEGQHLNWLLLQLNKNKGLPEINNMLIELNKNWLFYNPQIAIEYLSKQKFVTKIEIYLNIKWKVVKILNLPESIQDRNN